MITFYSIDNNGLFKSGNLYEVSFTGNNKVYMDYNGEWFQMKDNTTDSDLFRDLVPVKKEHVLLMIELQKREQPKPEDRRLRRRIRQRLRTKHVKKIQESL